MPMVSAVTSSFIGLARTVASSDGAPDMAFVVVPHPMGMIAKEAVEGKAVKAFPEILKAATEAPTVVQSGSTGRPYPADRLNLTGTHADINDLFFEKGWSLGMPVTLPTASDVQRMLGGTRRKPDEVLGKVPPRMATLTVELVAVHALMAGCKPEYMPLLIATMEALLTPEVNWGAALATTATSETVVIVNGPVVGRIGLASEQGAAGKGHRANAAIGYAINLIAYIVGGSKPPAVDKSTLGGPGDFVCWIFGENESRLPPGWAPLHIDRGFKKLDSVVTVVNTYPPVDNIDHWSVTPEEHLRWWSHLINPMMSIGGPCNILTMDKNPIVALGPEHAQLIASAGWSKERFRQLLWEQARLPLSVWPAGCRDTNELAEKLGPLTSGSLIPITFRPEQFLVVVAGGDGKQSHYFPQFPPSLAASRLVME